MTVDHRSIARIFLVEGDSAEFRGTGFLVAPQHVVSCAHVLCGHTQWTKEKAEGPHDQIANVSLSFGENPGPDDRRMGIKFVCDKPDLALITLDKPVRSQPVRLVSGLTSDHKTALTQVKRQVIGFSQMEDTLQYRDVEGRLGFIADFHTQRVRRIQVNHGLSHGMSGSPFLVESGGEAVCFGLAFLGGDGASMSCLIAAGTVIEFLQRCDVAPEIVEASGFFRYDEEANVARWENILSPTWIRASGVAAFIFLSSLHPIGPVELPPTTLPVEAPMQQAAPVACNSQVRAGWLLAEEARSRISQAIQSGNEGQALCRLDEMEPGVAKTQECERLYGYAIKEKKFDLATSVAERCWKGTIQQRYLRDIWHERLKQ